MGGRYRCDSIWIQWFMDVVCKMETMAPLIGPGNGVLLLIHLCLHAFKFQLAPHSQQYVGGYLR